MVTHRRLSWRLLPIASLTALLHCSEGTGTHSNSTLILTELSVGSNHTCGVMEDSVAVCWGYNGSHELGPDTSYSSVRPVRVGTARFAGLTAGPGISCGPNAEGRALCWGTLYDYDAGYWGNGSPSAVDSAHAFVK